MLGSRGMTIKDEVQSIKYKVRRTRCEVQSTKYEARCYLKNSDFTDWDWICSDFSFWDLVIREKSVALHKIM